MTIVFRLVAVLSLAWLGCQSDPPEQNNPPTLSTVEVPQREDEQEQPPDIDLATTTLTYYRSVITQPGYVESYQDEITDPPLPSAYYIVHDDAEGRRLMVESFVNDARVYRRYIEWQDEIQIVREFDDESVLKGKRRRALQGDRILKEEIYDIDEMTGNVSIQTIHQYNFLRDMIRKDLIQNERLVRRYHYNYSGLVEAIYHFDLSSQEETVRFATKTRYNESTNKKSQEWTIGTDGQLLTYNEYQPDGDAGDVYLALTLHRDEQNRLVYTAYNRDGTPMRSDLYQDQDFHPER